MLKHPSEAIAPRVLAEALDRSIRNDHEPRAFHPEDGGDLLTLARWGRNAGLEAPAREALKIPAAQIRVEPEELAAYLASHVSPHPERFAEVVAGCKAFERWALARDSERLKGCGHPWGHVVRLFWKDRKNRERIKTLGLHSCKHRWCPRCGRPRQQKLSDEIERCLELAREWGFTEGHVRFVTLTIPNGASIPELRERAHTSWAKLQRTRWWPKHVFGWFRGTEVVTGDDGAWNLHLHVVVLLWSPWISYQQLDRVWTREAGIAREGGKNLVVDVEKLRRVRNEARGRGLTRAAKYIVKYITKREELTKLRNGPGGLAHLVGSTRRMRAFAVGGGCSVLRRLLDVLLPAWALRAEQAIEDTHLSQGVAPWRAEEVDPQTGEARDIEPPSPFVDAAERRRWEVLGRALEQMGGTVGLPCGPKGRFRRVGSLPLRSQSPTVTAWKKAPALEGLRALVAHGVWKLHTWEDAVKEYRTVGGKRVPTGGTRILKYSAVLPARRYAWRPIAQAVWAAMVSDAGRWSRRRAEGFRAHADAKVGAIDQLDHLRAMNAVDQEDRAHTGRKTTTRRALLARKLEDLLVFWMGEEPETYLERREGVRAHIGQLRQPHPFRPQPRPDPSFMEAFW